MKTSRFAHLLTALCVTLSLAGCNLGPLRKSTGTHTQAADRKKAEEDQSRTASATGIKLRWNKKTESGGQQRVIDIDAKTGNLNPQAESGVMSDTHGIMYRNDKARARFTAPIVDADRARNRVEARGGVTVRSIDPPGITVTAERIVWDSGRNLITAEGSGTYTQVKPGQSRPVMSGRFRRIEFDTQIERFKLLPPTP